MFRTGFAAHTLPVEVQPQGGEEGASKAVECPPSRDHPVAGGLVVQREGSGLFVPRYEHMK